MECSSPEKNGSCLGLNGWRVRRSGIWPERGEEAAADEAMAGSCGGRRKARWEELGSVYHMEERRTHPGRRLRVKNNQDATSW